jgi:hypothetical protein
MAITERSRTSRCERRERRTAAPGSGGSLFLLLGFVGALVFFWTRAVSAGDHLLAILQALVWPAYLVYGALQALFG